jgi:ubiquinone/menaquinone biosynthesis C-methylase UbiE
MKMGLYAQWLFPRILDLAMRQKQMVRFREQIGKAAEGQVLDVGIGSGVNLAFYSSQVSRVYGVDPSPALLHVARERAREAQAPVELVCGSGEALPLENKSVDTVAVTFTLCSVGDPVATLTEARRVLRPNGRLLFVEHGRAPEAAVARWQDRLTPLWKQVAGGCHLNRKPDDLLRSAGFKIETLDTGYLRGPRAMAFVYSGSAHPI